MENVKIFRWSAIKFLEYQILLILKTCVYNLSLFTAGDVLCNVNTLRPIVTLAIPRAPSRQLLRQFRSDQFISKLSIIMAVNYQI